MQHTELHSPTALLNRLAQTYESHTAEASIEAVVFYRQPRMSNIRVLVQHTQPLTLQSLDRLPLTGGYVVMPFEVTSECPIVFIEPDEYHTFQLPAPAPSPSRYLADDKDLQRAAYTCSFAQAHQPLLQGEVQKIVLSRCLNVSLKAENITSHPAPKDMHPLHSGYNLFVRACHSRPDSYVSFWWTRPTGAWLAATPEPLLEKREQGYGTVALAGTLPWHEGATPMWDPKNREEQAIVARFIAQQLNEVTTSVQQSATFTLHTGNIQHLCTDFNFEVTSPELLRNLLKRLHPTPAVCGLPRSMAHRVIKTAEATARRYYAGFNGPFLLQGDTSLYVSLRCMEFTTHNATLYAGGGLMPESREEEEWDETQRKLQTMLRLL